MNSETLVHMANQIARAFASEPEPQAVVATADHIRLFWDPRMRHGIEELARSGEPGLLPVARAAVLQLVERETAH